MQQVIALIPARSGSKGVKHKNIRELGGRSLMEWSVAACLKSQLIERVLVSTDDRSYAQHAAQIGAEAPFLRPEGLSGDRSTDFEFVSHALRWFDANGQTPNLIIHIRPTTPFRDPAVIDSAIKTFVASKGFTALRSVHPMSESAYKSFEISPGGQLKMLGATDTLIEGANVARQELPQTFTANGYVDVLSVPFIRQNKLLHGHCVLPFITSPVRELDNEDDFKQLEYQLAVEPEILSLLFD